MTDPKDEQADGDKYDQEDEHDEDDELTRPVYVLDTGAFLGRSHPEDGELLTTEAAVGEVFPAAALRYIQQLHDLELLILAEPPEEALDQIKDAAKDTGDAPDLSDTDLGLLALALDQKATLVTSDHRMQNVAMALDIPIHATTEGAIKEQWQWYHRCVGCWKRYAKDTAPESGYCLICGQVLKRVRKR